MTLLERFIEIGNWPTSRKTALLCGLAFPTTFAASLISHFALVDTGVMHMFPADLFFFMGPVVAALCFGVSLIAARVGYDAPWTAHLFIVLYGAFIWGLVYVTGTWSTPFITFYPLAATLLALLYGARLAWFGFFYGLVSLGLLGMLGTAHVIPYAPAMQNRALDAQASMNWVLAVFIPVMMFFLFCFVLSVLTVSARSLQARRLELAHQHLDRSARAIRRYVPAQVADAILGGAHEPATGHQRRRLTLFFSDLVGFTEIAERMEPEDLSRVLNEYFFEMTTIAHRHGGTIDELSGDAIFIFFGAPLATDDQDHALRATRMAIEMQQGVTQLNAKWQHNGIMEALRVRMGINTGVVTIGNFGSPERMKYAALGKHVNLAARLQANCEPGKVLLSHATWLLVHQHLPCVPKGEMALKGIHKPVMTYEPVMG
jgi:class 3 adenylate cyclase